MPPDTLEDEQAPNPVPADKQDALLKAIRALSSQVGALQLVKNHCTVSKLKEAKTEVGDGAPTQDESVCSPRPIRLKLSSQTNAYRPSDYLKRIKLNNLYIRINTTTIKGTEVGCGAEWPNG